MIYDSVLTIPEQLREVFYNNRHDANLLSALMRCGYECLEDVVSSVKRLSLKIGIIVVSDPWSIVSFQSSFAHNHDKWRYPY
jgi:hypothetical protein